MKKLLLILLCLPFIGFGQQTYVPDDNFEQEYYEAEFVKEGELSLFGKIKDTFISGGVGGMSILSFILLLTLASIIFLKNKYITILVGFMALLVGISFSMLGLYGAYDAIEVAGDISPSLVAGGAKVALITTFYGLIIFTLSVILTVISLIFKKR